MSSDIPIQEDQTSTGPNRKIIPTTPGFWYSNIDEDDLLANLSQDCESIVPFRKTTPSTLKKRPHLFKPFPKHYARRRTSIFNYWSALVNFDLLEESCAWILSPSFLPNKSVKAPPSSQNFKHSVINLPGSNVTFVRGISNPESSKSSPTQQDSDVESIVCASSEEVDRCEADDDQDEIETIDSYGKDVAKLFQSKDNPIIGKVDASLFSPNCKKTIPQNLIAIVEDCGITLS